MSVEVGDEEDRSVEVGDEEDRSVEGMSVEVGMRRTGVWRYECGGGG